MAMKKLKTRPFPYGKRVEISRDEEEKLLCQFEDDLLALAKQYGEHGMSPRAISMGFNHMQSWIRQYIQD